MKTFRTIATIAAFSIASVSAATASGPKATAKAPKVTTQAPKASGQAPKGSAKAPKSATAPSTTSATSKSGKSIGSSKKSSSTTVASTTTGGTSSTSTTTATTPAQPEPNAISTKISGKPDQLARIQGMLPQGMTLEQATAGFKNQGQFIATLNASKNQGLSFADLQKAVTVDGLSVGQAVKKVKAAPPAPTTTTPTTTTPTTTTPAPTTPAPGGSGGGSL